MPQAPAAPSGVPYFRLPTLADLGSYYSLTAPAFDLGAADDNIVSPPTDGALADQAAGSQVYGPPPQYVTDMLNKADFGGAGVQAANSGWGATLDYLAKGWNSLVVNYIYGGELSASAFGGSIIENEPAAEQQLHAIPNPLANITAAALNGVVNWGAPAPAGQPPVLAGAGLGGAGGGVQGGAQAAGGNWRAWAPLGTAIVGAILGSSDLGGAPDDGEAKDAYKTADGQWIEQEEIDARPDMQVRGTGKISMTNEDPPYIGSSDDVSWRDATSRDGRDRSDVQILDEYLQGDWVERYTKEYNWVNEIGIENLDNKIMPPNPDNLVP